MNCEQKKNEMLAQKKTDRFCHMVLLQLFININYMVKNYTIIRQMNRKKLDFWCKLCHKRSASRMWSEEKLQSSYL